MERRDWSLKALENLIYIDSLDDEMRAKSLQLWVEENLGESSIEDFDLEVNELKQLSELFYRNIKFLKSHTNYLKESLDQGTKIKEFLN